MTPKQRPDGVYADRLTHFDDNGQAHMVNIGDKAQTHRVAVASGTICMQRDTFTTIQSGSAEKGDVLGIARIAAIMGAKRTSDLIPLCHPLALTKVAVDFELDESSNSVTCQAQVETYGQTGVEMEALTAVQVGLLTIYGYVQGDGSWHGSFPMCACLEKHGGKSGDWSVKRESADR